MLHFSVKLSLTLGFYTVSGALIAPLTSAQDSLSGVYRQDITVSKKGMFFERGDKIISEAVIIDGEGTQSDVTMNIAAPAGVVCSLENGQLSNVTQSLFDIVAKDPLFGEVCTLSLSVKGQTLRITGADNCSDFCGYGASFKCAKLKRVCTADLKAAATHLKDKFYVNAENAFECPEPE